MRCRDAIKPVVAALAAALLLVPAVAQARVARPPILLRASADSCAKASSRFAAAHRRHASEKELTAAYRQILKACSARFDVTAVTGTFDAKVTTEDHNDSCKTVNDAHWTAARGPGAAFAGLEVFSIDRRGRPSYAFGMEIPLADHGSGTATTTCNEPSPGSNGTTTCTFNLDQAEALSVQTDTGRRLDPQTLEWGFGYNSFAYSRPSNGGACSYSGPRPPFPDDTLDSPSLSVAGFYEGTKLEPLGITTVPASKFSHSLTLEFSGSTTNSVDSTLDAGTLEASWQMSASLRRLR